MRTENRFAIVVITIMVSLFIINTAFSMDCNLIMIILTGGGKLVDVLGASYYTVYEKFQMYRLISYGYMQPTIWHLLANVYALWYVGLYLEKNIGMIRLFIVYHVGMIIACAAFFLFFPNGYMYGASPAIFCCLGLMATWAVKDRLLLSEYKSHRGSRYLICYFVISNFVGLGTFIVHLLGFCVGMVLGIFGKKEKI